MRSGQTIVNILNYVAKVWCMYPSLSFCQLLEKCIPTLKRFNYTDEELVYFLTKLDVAPIECEVISSEVVPDDIKLN